MTSKGAIPAETSKTFPVTQSRMPFVLQAVPETLEIDLLRTAVIVVDMQNAFVSKGGIHDLLGRNVSNCQKIIGPIRQILDTARANKVRVIHVARHHSRDFHDSGGPGSPNWGFAP